MMKPRIQRSSFTLLYEFCAYLLARLLADEETADAAAPLSEARSGVRDAMSAEREAFEARAQAKARRDHAVFRWERAVRQFELALLAQVNRQRDAAVYRLFFPNGLTSLLEQPLHERLQRGEEIERSLAEGLGPPGLVEWAGVLEARRSAVRTMLAAWETAVSHHRHARAIEREARTKWVNAYVATYGELVRRFSDDRDRVESYFPRHIRRKQAVEDDDDADIGSAPSAGKEVPAA